MSGVNGSKQIHHPVPTGCWDGPETHSMDDRYAVASYGSIHAQRQEVADSRTPLSVLLQGESEERAATNRAITAAAERIMDRVERETGEVAEWSDLSRSEWEDLIEAAIADEIQETRVNTLRAMLRYFWDGGLNPWGAMKKLLATTREVAAHLIHGVSQTEVAFLLGETKAATSAREKKFEAMLLRWGAKGVHLVGGGKSDEAREVYREIRKGNKSRAKGERRKRAEQLRKGRAGEGDGNR